jgi:prefoldin subunit 5
VSGIVDLLKEVLTLTSSVAGLKSDIQRINTLVLEMNERIIRLEAAAELNAERAKNEALTAFHGMNQQLVREMCSLQAQIDGIGSRIEVLGSHKPELRLASTDGVQLEKPVP